MDNNNVPELAIRDKARKETFFWTYYKGKMRSFNFSYDDPAGTRFVGYYKKTGVFYKINPSWNYYMILNNGRPNFYLRENHGQYGGKYWSTYYKVNASSSSFKETEITRAQYYKYLKAKVGNKSISRVVYHKNTAANRKKYLK